MPFRVGKSAFGQTNNPTTTIKAKCHFRSYPNIQGQKRHISSGNLWVSLATQITYVQLQNNNKKPFSASPVSFHSFLHMNELPLFFYNEGNKPASQTSPPANFTACNPISPISFGCGLCVQWLQLLRHAASLQQRHRRI